MVLIWILNNIPAQNSVFINCISVSIQRFDTTMLFDGLVENLNLNRSSW